MSETLVRVPFGTNGADKATLLLAAAEAAGQEATVVKVDTQGAEHAFIVPKDLADTALSGEDAEGVTEHVDPFGNAPAAEVVTDYPQAQAEQGLSRAADAPEEKPVAKKATAKKTAAKKAAPRKRAAAKKAPAKKTASK